MESFMELLSEPYLLDPHPNGVHVVWHTEWAGDRHVVVVGPAVAGWEAERVVEVARGRLPRGDGWRRVMAATTALRCFAEDRESRVPGRSYEGITERPVFRHWATVDGLAVGRAPYRVVSFDGERVAVSERYSLTTAPAVGAPARLLLTSDHQLGPMVAANVAKAAETVGVELDGVLVAGDMPAVPGRASDWFDDAEGSAFLAVMTGRGSRELHGRSWAGAPFLQHTPLYPALGNHEVMGGAEEADSLTERFHRPRPGRWDVRAYSELFPVPASGEGGQRWWARTVGDVFVVALFVASVWRPYSSRPVPGRPAKDAELAEDVPDPGRWAGGQFLFEPCGRGSDQFRWLEAQLRSQQARRARYRVVMAHQTGHGIGVHPPMAVTDPVREVTRNQVTGAPEAVRYTYPLADDYTLRDLAPLFGRTGVNLVLMGHAHLWQRFRDEAGVHWLETSNVGNTFGAYHSSSGHSRPVPEGDPDQPAQGDPGGLEPVVPTVDPLRDETGTPLPYLASGDVTAFSVLDSAAGVVRSYRFDTRVPDGPVVLFDEFSLA